MSSMMMSVSESVNVSLIKLSQDVCKKTIAALASKYGFSAADAEEFIGPLTVSKAEKKTKKVAGGASGVKKEKVRGPVVPLPFSGEMHEGVCHGLKQNHGLLTQCDSSCNSEGDQYCSGCLKQCDKNASGKPDNGCIEDRMQAYESGVEFRDPKGRAPTAYAKVMQKLKLTEDQVIAEAARRGCTFDSAHLLMPESKRGRPKKEGSLTVDTESDAGKKRGRPKKASKAVEVTSTEDLFATLISEVKAASPRPVVVQDDQQVSDLSGSESDGESSKKSKKSKMSASEKAEKEAAKAALAAEKEAAKAALAAEKAALAAEKAVLAAEKEAAKAALIAEKEALAAEKEAAKAALAAEKEAAKAALAAEKEAAKAALIAEKEAKKAALIAEKEAKKVVASVAKETKKGVTEKVTPKVAKSEPEVEAEVDEPDVILSVKKFMFKEIEYLRTSENILYHADTKECAGVFNEERQEIDECELEEESEEEEDD